MIYTAGYQKFKSQAQFVELVTLLDAAVLDVRYSARSKEVEWLGTRLAQALGRRYKHVRALGNVNYKHGDLAPIQIFDIRAGLEVIRQSQAKYENVVLLCACWQYTTCHRAVIAGLLETAGIESQEIFKPAQMIQSYLQPSLF